MDSNYKVSVILPVYNGEKTIFKTLESLSIQTFKNFELIVCIDGSKDQSENIINGFKDKFNRLVILKNEFNLGLGPTLNRLVANTNTNYIAIAEQDDVYYPERLALQTEVLDNDIKIGLVSGIADFWDGNEINFRFPGILVNGNKYPEKEEMFLLNYRNQIKVVNSCMMFRKDIHIKNGLYFSKHYPSVSVDWSYILRFSLISKIYGINRSLVKLDRRRERNSVTTNKKKQFEASRELIRAFQYEYPEIITKKDFKYAMSTQNLMELSHVNKYKFIFYFLSYFLRNPLDERWFKYLKKRALKII